ncbi:MAG: SH3 domain-containing protein [Acidobacteriota bacterium]
MRLALGTGGRIRHRLILCACAFALLSGCSWGGGKQPVLGYAYTAPASLNLRDELGLRASTVATVQHGERLQIIETKRKFVKVRTAQGAEGWTDSALLMGQAQMDDLAKLSARAAEIPSQGAATVFDTLNVHTGASRASASYVQLGEGDKIDVIGHRVSDRGTAPPTPDAPRPLDDWFLIRTPDGKAGWVLSRMVLMSVPDEVAQYAEGHYIQAYRPLGEARDPETNEMKTNWLWATSVKTQQAYDFDSFRVFVWSPKRKGYVTSYIEHGIKGYYPVENVKAPGEEGEAFSLVVEDNKDGALYKKTFAFRGGRVKMILKEPYQRPAPLPDVGVAKAFDAGAPGEQADSWSQKVKKFGVRWFGL